MTRWLRRISTVVVLTVAIVLLILLLVAWGFTHNLTNPHCPDHQLPTGIYQPQEHWLTTLDGIEIRIWYYPSSNQAAVITFGGLTGSLGDRVPPVNALLQAGFGIVQVDTRACARPPALVTLGANEVYDAQAALDFLQAAPEVDPDRIGAMGFSMGGATAIRLAARQTTIRGVVRDGGYASLEELFQPHKGDPLTARLLRIMMGLIFYWQTGIEIQAVQPIEALQKISPRPVLLIYGESEADSGLAQFQASDETVSLWIVPGGSHGKNHLIASQEYQQRLLDFFNATLLDVKDP